MAIKTWQIKENVEDVTFEDDVQVLDNFIPTKICRDIQHYAFHEAEWTYTNQSEGQEKSRHWGASVVAYPNPDVDSLKEYIKGGKKDWKSIVKKCPAIGKYWEFLKKNSPVKEYLPETPTRGLLNCCTGGHGDISHLDHSDNLYVVTHILYLNDDLDIDDGGQTEFYDRDRSEIIGAVSSKFGRVSILDARIPHAGKAPWIHYTGRRITLGIQCFLLDNYGNFITQRASNKNDNNCLKRNNKGPIMEKIQFGPIIGKFKMPSEVVKAFIKTTDTTLKEREQKWGSYLAGKIEEEWQIPKKNVTDNSVKYLEESLKTYVIEAQPEKGLYKKKNIKVFIRAMWVNEMKENEYNPMHSHDNTLSAVFFLKVPDVQDSIQKPGREDRDGWLEFVHEHAHVVKPEVGNLYIFPGTLRHGVYPFKGKGVRRSVSFNIEWRNNNE